MTDDNDVSITGESADGVREGFAFFGRRCALVDIENAPTEPSREISLR